MTFSPTIKPNMKKKKIFARFISEYDVYYLLAIFNYK